MEEKYAGKILNDEELSPTISKNEFNIETQKKMRSFCRDLARRVRRYYADEEHRKEFEEWYFKKYGKQYVWKRLSDIRREKQEKDGRV